MSCLALPRNPKTRVHLISPSRVPSPFGRRLGLPAPRRPGALPAPARLHDQAAVSAPARDRRPDYRSRPCARPPTGATPARDRSIPYARPEPPLRATADRSCPCARLEPPCASASARFCFSGPNVYFGPILYFRPLLFLGRPFKARHV
jgi:hypothetical protein